MRLLLFLLLLFIYLPSDSSADCGCGSQCLSYTSSVQCTRCCTHSVKRSIQSMNELKRRFLWGSEMDGRRNEKKERDGYGEEEDIVLVNEGKKKKKGMKVHTPIWRKRREQDDGTKPLLSSIIRYFLSSNSPF